MDRPLCSCHGEPMHRANGDGWRCAVKAREWRNKYERRRRAENPESDRARVRKWRAANPEKARERPDPETLRRYRARFRERCADQLARGDQIAHAGHHHQGMAELKARLGDPRPDGLTLSLVNPDGPSAYWGTTHGRPYRLSVDPADYVWESQAANNARSSRREKRRTYAARG